jgi:hypothetical protein
MGEILNELFNQGPDIIGKAAQSPLRLASLGIRSTRLSQEQDVGVKCRMKRLCLASQRFTAGVLWVA